MSKVAGANDEISAYRPRAIPEVPLNVARRMGVAQDIVPIAVAQGKNEFGNVCIVTENLVVMKAGATLNDVHAATGIPVAELKAGSNLTDPTAKFWLPVAISRKSTPDVYERVAKDGREERLSADPLRVWTNREGLNGAKFRVDRTDSNHIVAKIRIRLSGSAADIATVRAREQEIEDVLRTSRLSVDVEFVEGSDGDAYKVKLSGAWPVQNNWRPNSDPRTFAHEIGHSLGLDDTYDYRSHCDNMEMSSSDRKYWCLRGKIAALRGFVPTVDLMSGAAKLSDKQVDEIAGW